jgi:hypothetical protein
MVGVNITHDYSVSVRKIKESIEIEFVGLWAGGGRRNIEAEDIYGRPVNRSRDT